MRKVKNVAFIGLGVMGYHMAGHLSKNQDFSVIVWNRTKNRADKWGDEHNGNVANVIKDAVVKADVVLICAGKDEDVEEIIFSDDGVLQNTSGSIVIDHTTTSYNLSQKLSASLKEKDIEFIDAPVSGGEVGAINGQLSIMAGGNEEIIKATTPILKCYAKNITYIGGCGYGQLAKMVNQICIVGVLQGLSEAILFAESENINIEKLLVAISGGAAQSWQMENRALTMTERKFDFGFAIKWMAKDLGYCLNRAKDNKTDLSFTKTIYDKYISLMENGGESLDTSALILHNNEDNKACC